MADEPYVVFIDEILIIQFTLFGLVSNMILLIM